MSRLLLSQQRLQRLRRLPQAIQKPYIRKPHLPLRLPTVPPALALQRPHPPHLPALRIIAPIALTRHAQRDASPDGRPAIQPAQRIGRRLLAPELVGGDVALAVGLGWVFERPEVLLGDVADVDAGDAAGVARDACGADELVEDGLERLAEERWRAG